MSEKSYQNFLDCQLIQCIREDDQTALEELFSRYYLSLCTFAFHYLRDSFLTEEVVSDVFLKLWLKRHELRVKSNFKAYIFTSTRNHALNCLRKERKENIDLDEVVDLLEDFEFSADHLLIKREFTNRIDTLMNSLPTRRAQVFRLSRIEGFSYQEIAEILSISVYTVQNHMVQAVKQLALQAFQDKDS